MKTRNLLIYHCQCCGRVMHQGPDVDPPVCCERLMTRAAAKTICEPEERGPAGDVAVGGDATRHLRPEKPR